MVDVEGRALEVKPWASRMVCSQVQHAAVVEPFSAASSSRALDRPLQTWRHTCTYEVLSSSDLKTVRIV